MLSSLRVATPTAYVPWRQELSAAAQRSSRWKNDIKNNRPVSGGGGKTLLASEMVGRLAAQDQAAGAYGDVLQGEFVLVPVPRSSKRVKDQLWPGLEIAEAMLKAGVGTDVLELVERHKSVHRSSTSGREGRERTTAEQHYESLRTTGLLLPAEKVVLVDDVVTSGATLIAAASCITEAYEGTQVEAFVAIRTCFPRAFDSVRSPAVKGITHYPSGKCFREE